MILVVTERKMPKYTAKVFGSMMDSLEVKEWDEFPLFPSDLLPKELKKKKQPDWEKRGAKLSNYLYKNKGTKVLVCGAASVACVMGFEKQAGIIKHRGRGQFTPEGNFMVATYSPQIIIGDIDMFRDIVFDVEKLHNNFIPIVEPKVTMTLATSAKDVKDLLATLHDEPFLAIDTETTDFNPHNAHILSIGFCRLTRTGRGHVVIIPQKFIGPAVGKFLKTYKGVQVFHNIQFDYKHIWKKFGHFIPEAATCSLLMNYGLDERPINRYKQHGLKLLSRLHFDADDYDIDMGAWLEEYFRTKPVKADVKAYQDKFMEEHPEKTRKLWREEDPERPWRGLKVGRDIDVEDCRHLVPLPIGLRPQPNAARKKELWDAMLVYMGWDCFHTARLYKVNQAAMDEESPRLSTYVHGLLVPLAFALGRAEALGCNVDKPYMEKVQIELTEHLLEELADAQESVFKLTGREEFNPNSSKQVGEVLYNARDENGLGLKQPVDAGRNAYKRDEGSVTTNADTLKVLAREVAVENEAISDLIHKILLYRRKSKILGTYVTGLLDRLDDDGRVRGQLNIPGTSTGRLSSSNPNLQNIPDASHVGYDVRKAYIPTKDWVIMEADYSQLELRVAALFSQDKVLMDAYEQGADIHQEVAYMLWDKPKEEITKYERYLAKCMNFGVLYGRGAKSIATGPEMDNLIQMSGRAWTMGEIEKYFDKFLKGYKELFEWMDVLKEHCFKEQFVEDPLGHRRRFDLILNSNQADIGRRIVNTPIQGFAAKITCNAIVELDKILDPEEARILFTVHDSIVLEARKPIAADTARLVKEIMQTKLPENVTINFPMLPHSPMQMGDVLEYNVPLVAEVELGKSWGECKHSIDSFETEEEDTVGVYSQGV